MKTEETTEPQPQDAQPRHAEAPALRALAEAEARRRERGTDAATRPPEVDGRPGLDPARYGDWENKGIASDF